MRLLEREGALLLVPRQLHDVGGLGGSRDGKSDNFPGKSGWGAGGREHKF